MNEHTTCRHEYEGYPENRIGKVTLREITSRLFFRFRIFLFCAIAIPIISVYLVYLVPPKYEASAKLLIGYDDSVSPYFKEITVSKRQIISGQSNAEILKSLKVCARVVEELDIEPSDISKPAYKIFLSRIAVLYYTIFGNPSENSNKESKDDLYQLAKEFQNTIEPKIILKGRQEIEVNDELIEVTLTSFNHDKVAAMTNQVCNEFIEEYYSLYAEEAERAYSYLNQQIAKIEQEIRNGNFETLKNRKLPMMPSKGENQSSGRWSERNVQANPLVESIARQVADLELKLGRLTSTFSENSPEVINAKNELSAARNRLNQHKAKESADAVLNILKEKQQQAEMSLQIYSNRLIPISVVEKAVSPKKSSIIIVGRYFLTGFVGLFAGLTIGLVMVMFFSAIDNRIYTPWDVDNGNGYSVIGSIPEIQSIGEKPYDPDVLPYKESASAVMSALGRLDLTGTDKGTILVVTGASKGEGKTFTVLQIASAIAHDKRVKILVVDANFGNPELSRILGSASPETEEKKGLIDFLKGDEKIISLILKTEKENLFLLPAGKDLKRLSLGFFKKSLKTAFKEIRSEYDLIIVDSPGLMVSTDAAMFASESDNVMIITKAGSTRREILKQSIVLLNESGARLMGVVMNFRKYPIPRFFYRKG